MVGKLSLMLKGGARPWFSVTSRDTPSCSWDWSDGLERFERLWLGELSITIQLVRLNATVAITELASWLTFEKWRARMWCLCR